MEIIIHSNIGKRRTSNQDYADYFVSQAGQALFILCDGVGGSQAGDVASEMTTKFLGNRFELVDKIMDKNQVEDWLITATGEVNDYIYEMAQSNADYKGMSTTIVMAVIVDEYIIVSHVGDSRAYVFKNDEMIQLTDDHSLVNELIKTGQLTEEEGATHPRRNVITQAIGTPRLNKIEITQYPCEDVDVLMLCSDGLTNMVTKAELVEMFKNNQNIDELGRLLVQTANNAGGRDNITLILVSDLEEGGDDK